MQGNELLETVVVDGNVDYNRLESGQLDAALEAVATANLADMEGNEKYAFLINAYNLCTLDAVRRVLLRDGKQVHSLTNKVTWLRFFFFTKMVVGGERMSLSRLEFKHLKPFLARDPRGHFALVCASVGCPPLRGGVFHANTLDTELAQAGKAFCQPDHGYVWYNNERVLYLNRVFKWYKGDFKAGGGALASFLAHCPAACAKHIREGPIRIRYMPYDWSLNEVKP